MTDEETREWSAFCRIGGDHEYRLNYWSWYAPADRAGSATEDKQACMEDAKAGVERAVRYRTEFIKWKLTR